MFRPFRSSPAFALTLSLGLAATSARPPLIAQDVPTPAPEAGAPAAPATPSLTAVAPAEMVGPLILRDTPLDQILELIERYTGRVLLRSSAGLAPGTYTLTLDKPLPKAEALRALETILNMNGVGLSPLGDRFLKVTPLNLIRTESPEFVEGSTLDLPASGRIVTKLFTLSYLRVAEFVPQASQLLNPALNTAPIVFEKNNSVLFTDSISTLQRLERLIETLDLPATAGLKVKTYTIVNAKASDLVNKLRTLLSGPLAAQVGTATTYQPDDRTNQVLLIADEREQPFFDQLIARLDAEASPNTRSEVIFLKHANATDVATLLSQLISGQSSAASREGGGASGGTRTTRRTTNANNNAGGNNGAPPVAPAIANAAAVVNAAAASEEFSSYLTIVADERSNGIVIAGTPNDIKLVSSLVDRIDVLLAQVRIEVVIAEVSLSDGANSGITSMGLQVKDNKLVGFNGVFAGGAISGTGTDADGNPSGFATIDRVAGGYNLSGVVGLTATPRKNNTSILQTPSITTTHNKEAEIFVGETRPVISGTTTSTVNADTSSSTVTQQKIGIRLTVTPLIGSSGDVQLDIKTEVQDVSGTVQIDNNEQPIVSERSTTSYVSARNGDIIVLGGLQRNSQSKTSSRLGPIPFLGDLLGGRSRSKGRTELVFFLRPTVLTNTSLDNVEAMRRIDTTPQAKDVRNILETRPAAAPGASNIPPPEPKKSAKDNKRGSDEKR